MQTNSIFASCFSQSQPPCESRRCHNLYFKILFVSWCIPPALSEPSQENNYSKISDSSYMDTTTKLASVICSVMNRICLMPPQSLVGLIKSRKIPRPSSHSRSLLIKPSSKKSLSILCHFSKIYLSSIEIFIPYLLKLFFHKVVHT